ncbi:alanine racemase [Capsulimonas corticalis]|uniref:Alanine racemase n=1 Tax=Capsulimonas corticalis TaxID=2219043 RepID=A0A402CRI3_9BACT|nr:alanine racemase [Capsulimonas corticalis]BDI28050.1 alanine racemase [Capsulimonas corticalis]
MSLSPQSRTWAQIDADALAHNLANLQALYTQPYGARVMVIVKANAYGHGLEIIVRQAHALGARDFGVATTLEGVAARQIAGADARIYLLSPVTPHEADAIVAYDLTTVVSSREMGAALSKAAEAQAKTAEVHLDIDTGMGRSGFTTDEASDALAALRSLPNVRLTGIATHFASADEDPEDARAQLALFQSALAGLGERARGLTIHASNSPAAMLLGAAGAYQLVRPGLLLYGVEPAPGVWAQSSYEWRPVLSLKSRVILVHRLRAGDTVSYGKTYTVPDGGGVYATVGVGYGDGYSRRHTAGGCVLIHGRRAPIRGRVCMDQMVVDVSNIPDVQAGDIATIVGADGPEILAAGAMADAIGATPHEITTCLTSRVARVVVKG